MQRKVARVSGERTVEERDEFNRKVPLQSRRSRFLLSSYPWPPKRAGSLHGADSWCC